MCVIVSTYWETKREKTKNIYNVGFIFPPVFFSPQNLSAGSEQYGNNVGPNCQAYIARSGE